MDYKFNLFENKLTVYFFLANTITSRFSQLMNIPHVPIQNLLSSKYFTTQAARDTFIYPSVHVAYMSKRVVGGAANPATQFAGQLVFSQVIYSI